MQFHNNALSASYSASLEAESFLAQSLTRRPEDEEAAARQAKSDAREERQLRRRERQKRLENRQRRPSTLHNFILGADDRIDTTLDEEDEDDDETDDDEEDDDQALEAGGSVFDDESVAPDNASRISGRHSHLRHSVNGTGGSESLAPPNALASSTSSIGGGGGRKLSMKSSRRPSTLAPIGEGTPLLSSRRASMATLTPRPLQKLFKGPTASASKKVGLAFGQPSRVAARYSPASVYHPLLSINTGIYHPRMVHHPHLPHPSSRILASPRNHRLCRSSRYSRACRVFPGQHDHERLRAIHHPGSLCAPHPIALHVVLACISDHPLSSFRPPSTRSAAKASLQPTRKTRPFTLSALHTSLFSS